MGPVLKRLLNVGTIVCSVFVLFFIGIMIMGGVSNWYQFLPATVVPTVGGYLAIAIVKCILFGV